MPRNVERSPMDPEATRERMAQISRALAWSRMPGKALRGLRPRWERGGPAVHAAARLIWRLSAKLGEALDSGLRDAIEKWSTKRAKAYIALGADPGMIVYAEHGMDACSRSARIGNCELILWLCAAGADPNRPANKAWRAIHHASLKGHGPAIMALSCVGADPSATVDTGWSPLMIAARENRLDAIEALCELGVEVDHRQASGPGSGSDRGETAFMLCCRRGFEDAARALLRRGARIGYADRRGFQAIHLAASEGHDGIVEMLLDAGADSEEPGPWSKSPLGIARAEGHASTLALLERHAFAKAKLAPAAPEDAARGSSKGSKRL